MQERRHDLSEHWGLALFKPNSHRIAERNLVRQGMGVFFPLQSVTRRERGRFVRRDVALFPGYIFVRINPEAGDHRKVRSTLGISNLVSVGDRPAVVPDQIVNGLRARCNRAGILDDQSELNVGDEIKLTTGPFADFIATVEEIDPQKRVWVLIDLLGRSTRMAVDSGAWRAA